MSTPDQPGTPPLTRRQLRELRNTASTPIITPEDAYEAAAAAAAERAAAEDAATDTADASTEAVVEDAPAEDIVEDVPAEDAVEDAPEEDAVEDAPEGDPAPVDPAPQPHIPAAVDLDAAPITRRQARQQAKLRTAAIEVIPTDAPADAEPADENAPAASDADAEVHGDIEIGDEDVHDEPDVHDRDEIRDADEVDDEAEVHDESEVHDEVEVRDEAEVHDEADADADEAEAHDEADADADEADADADEADAPADEADRDDDAATAHVVSPGLGAQLLAGEPGSVELPPSFDHLLSRGSAGSSSAPNALILSQTPETGSLSVPILGTGELLITGSYALPETYGSTGTVPGAQDGKDVDAALIDGELPPASSPTPIAASAAISTIKSADEIIRPPAPEKGSRLMMTLAITAGALALALATVLILAVVNGVF